MPATDSRRSISSRKVATRSSGGLAAEQQHVVFGMAEIACRHRPEVACDPHVGLGGGLQRAALHHAHDRIDDGFRGQTVSRPDFRPNTSPGR